jgi:hypothetical protein
MEAIENSKSSFTENQYLAPRHVVNLQCDQRAILQTCQQRYLSPISSFTVVILSACQTCHFINLPLKLHFINLPFHQFAISSICHFINFPLKLHFINFFTFTLFAI